MKAGQVLRIAVVGCGTAGSAAALYLARAGQEVTLFERFPVPQPVGAGLLLQPSGIAVLNELGLLPEVRAGGAKVCALSGVNHLGRQVLDLHYRDLAPDYFGIGIHRARLFDALYGAVCRAGVTVKLGVSVDRVEQTADAAFVIAGDHSAGPFDLVIAADGSHSSLRRAHGHEGRTRPYPWAALWTMVPDPRYDFTDRLIQAYRLGRQMIGVLPAGCAQDGTPEVTLFWSLYGDDYGAWRQAGLNAWKDQVTALLPDAEPLLEAIESPDQLTFSRYLDVRPTRWVDRRLLYIGDAAHGTSPQLGQGANLALWDAKVLAECLDIYPLPQALRRYQALRRPSVRYYQWASRWLTPCFQSHSRWIPALRDALMYPVGRLPILHGYSLETLSGTRNGFVRRLSLAAGLEDEAEVHRVSES